MRAGHVTERADVRRKRRGGWHGTRAYAFAVLGLTGSGALRTVHLSGVLRIRRGGVWLFDPTPRHDRISL